MCSEFSSKYKIQGKLGEGTFSDVLQCKNLATREVVAVKILKKKFDKISEAKDLPELVALLKLPGHSNVLALLEYIFDHREGKLYMVFELMDMSLYDLIQAHKRCLPETKVKHLFYQLLKGVDHLHANGIFHRDIKPENILVKKTVLKLADLGSVRWSLSKQPYTEYVSTRWYRAPECILTAGCYSPKMDVWACGCVYYELLTSKPIFPGANDVDQLTRIHQIVGTPSNRVLAKMRGSLSRVKDVKFAGYPSISLAVILPFTSDAGREILKRMLVYDPDVRSNVRRLLDHRYFNDLRDNDFSIRYFGSSRSNLTPFLQNNSKTIKGNQSLICLQTLKLSTKEPIKNVKEDARKKLSTNSWGPSTNKGSFVFPYGNNKPLNKVVPTMKRKPTQSINKLPIIKSPPDKLERKQSKEENKLTKLQSGRILPAIIPKGLHKRIQPCNISLNSFTKDSLPSIAEI